jgi:glycosyltransferase involved in cell wall biosynthesis
MPASKIAFFMATSGHSGVDRVVKHLVPAMAELGHSVDVLKVRKHGPELEHVPPGVRIIDLGGSHVYTSLWRLCRYLRRERPDVLLSDKDRVNRAAYLACKLSGAPTRLVFRLGTTLSIDLADRGWLERWLQRQSVRHLYPRAYNFIVNSHGVLDDMVEFTGIGREHVQVVPNPVVPEALFSANQPRPEHPWFGTNQPPVILGLGELCERKDFETLLRAFARIRRERPCRLLILGRGKRRERLLSLAQALGIAEHVQLPGFIANPYPYLAHAALFGFTSRMEGSPFALIEALAVGTPVVATDCPSGPAEILGNGQYGALVPVGDHEAFARECLATLERPPSRDFLQEAARPYEIRRSALAYLSAMGVDGRRTAQPAQPSNARS